MEPNKIKTETHSPTNKRDRKTRSKPSDISDLLELPLILDSRMAGELLGLHHKTVEKMARAGELAGPDWKSLAVLARLADPVLRERNFFSRMIVQVNWPDSFEDQGSTFCRGHKDQYGS